jgi:hypothetical protein
VQHPQWEDGSKLSRRYLAKKRSRAWLVHGYLALSGRYLAKKLSQKDPCVKTREAAKCEMAEDEAPLPAGWEVIIYQSASRPSEYCYRNRITNKQVRVLERPTEPPPTGVDLLREPKNKSRWVGVSAVGKTTIKWQAKWHCSVLGGSVSCPIRKTHPSKLRPCSLTSSRQPAP